MAKVLSVTPNQGESEAAFAARVATEVEGFFGADSAVAEETSAEPTDVSEAEPVDEEPAPSA